MGRDWIQNRQEARRQGGIDSGKQQGREARRQGAGGVYLLIYFSLSLSTLSLSLARSYAFKDLVFLPGFYHFLPFLIYLSLFSVQLFFFCPFSFSDSRDRAWGGGS